MYTSPMKEIPLTRGYVALVDDGDFDSLNKFKWFALVSEHTVYATRMAPRPKRFAIYMHREILGIKSGVVDHRDRNGLNNQRANLRAATQQGNTANSKKPSDAMTSKYKGVWFDSARGKWAARIGFNNRGIHLGRFLTEAEAAKVYNDAAIKLFGEFARINEIEQ